MLKNKDREWIYTVLSPSELEAKRIEYYTPLQITQWMTDNPLDFVNPCVNYSWKYDCNVCSYPPSALPH